MVGLRNRICAVAKMVCAPQQTGLRRGRLSLKISPVALQAWECRFVNDADDALAFHRDKIDAHQIVMRQVHDAVAGKGAERHEQNEKNTREKFHGRNVTREFSSATADDRKQVDRAVPCSMLILRSQRLPNCNIARGAADPPQAGKTAGEFEMRICNESGKQESRNSSIWRP